MSWQCTISYSSLTPRGTTVWERSTGSGSLHTSATWHTNVPHSTSFSDGLRARAHRPAGCVLVEWENEPKSQKMRIIFVHVSCPAIVSASSPPRINPTSPHRRPPPIRIRLYSCSPRSALGLLLCPLGAARSISGAAISLPGLTPSPPSLPTIHHFIKTSTTTTLSALSKACHILVQYTLQLSRLHASLSRSHLQQHAVVHS